MKILVWGCSADTKKYISRVEKIFSVADFTDRKEELWGKEIFPGKRIKRLDEINAKDYDFCVIGSKRYKGSIEEAAIKLGFNKTQLVSTFYVLFNIQKWQKNWFLLDWENKVNSKNIKVLKKWFVVDNHLECLLQFNGLRWTNVLMTFLNFPENRSLKLVNVISGKEEIFDLDSAEHITYSVTDNSEVVKLVIENELFQIPWISFDVCDTETKKKFSSEKRCEEFSATFDEMQNFYFHDEDYLALRNFDVKGTILDIGANYGQSMYAFYKLNGSKIISVEPVPELYTGLCLLKEWFDKENRVEIINAGISDKREELTWYEPDNKRTSGSFDKEFIDSRARVLSFDITERKLPCERIDDLFYELNDLWFIKMDVEGLEYRAILSGMETIKKHVPILLLESNSYREKICELLQDWYELYYYNPEENLFVKEGSSGINYWLIPKKEYRKFSIENIEE